MKWFKLAIAAALAVALLIVLGARSSFWVDTVKSRIEAETGYRLRVGGETAVSFRPAPIISLRDVTLLTGEESNPEERLTAERIQVVLSLRDLLFGHPRIAEISLSRPTLRLPLPRERTVPAPSTAVAAHGSGRALPTIDRIAVEDGTIAFYGQSGRDEGQLNRVNFEVTHAPAAPGVTVTGSLYFGSQLVNVDLQSQTPPEYFEQLAIPLQVSVRAPGLFQDPLSVNAELRSRNNAIAVNTLSGKIGDSIFNGWANVDFAAGKPEITGDIDFNTLQIPIPDRGGAQQDTALSEPWSDDQCDFDPLNYFDARMRISTADLGVGPLRMTLVALETKLNKGVLQARLVNAALYGGTVEGTLALDASGVLPAHALDVHIAGVNALPFLHDGAGFDSLEGVIQADIGVLATGASESAAIYSLGGAADVRLYNGAVHGIDVAKITRSLSNRIVNGWHGNASDRTPLSALTAHFDLVNGVASTNNLTLAGTDVQMSGAGSIDISTKTLQMRVNPRLVDGQQNIASARDLPGPGQGTGAGIPVLIQGRWSAPRIFPDVSGVPNNPTMQNGSGDDGNHR
jgi:AsmA protein